MKVIKTPKANLESKRFRFFQLGLIVAFSLSLLAFRWTTYELEEDDSSSISLVPFETMEPELPVMSFRQKTPEVVKVQVDKNFFKISEKPMEVTVKKVLEKPMDLKLIPIDCPECDNEGPIDEPIIDAGPSGWITAERTPYFDECASPGDRTAESECTYAAIRNFVQKNTKYPTVPREIGIQGTVWLSFIINKKGEVSSIEVLKSPHSELSEAAVEGLSKLPRMNPGLQRLNPVDVKLEIPVRFTLR